MTRIEEIKARVAAATDGTARVERFDNEGGWISYQVESGIGEDMEILGWFSELNNMPRARANAELHAASYADIPYLLKELEKRDRALAVATTDLMALAKQVEHKHGTYTTQTFATATAQSARLLLDKIQAILGESE